MMRQLKTLALLLFLAVLTGVASAQTLPVPPAPDQADLDWMAANATVQLPHGHVMIEGDIAMPQDALNTRATYIIKKWKNGVVPYTFAAAVNSTQRAQVRAAMDAWESVAGVTFVARSSQVDFVEIIPDNGNWSYVGRIGGKQQLGLYNWNYKFLIAHELAHALGFLHEQSRPDRDQYVTINTGNITPGFEHNFNINAASSTEGAYDFCSVMHYGPKFFSKNGGDTIAVKPGYERYKSCMGAQNQLTGRDIAGMNVLYPASAPSTPGDTPQTAVAIPLDATFNFVENSANFTAVNDPAAACATSKVGKTVWFTIKPLYDHLLNMSASGYDTVIAVYTGSPGAFTPYACVDATTGGENLKLPLEAMSKYYVMIGSVGGSAGTLTVDNLQYRNLASSGGFDLDNMGWTIKSKPTNRLDDKRKCGGVGAFGSSCAIQFKGGPDENSVLTAKLTPANTAWNFASTNQYRFSMDVRNTRAEGAVSATATVIYTDGTRQITQLNVTGLTDGYRTVAADLSLTGAPVKNVKIKLTVTTTSGKSLVDNVVFYPQQSGLGLRGTQGAPAASTVLPVPPPAG